MRVSILLQITADDGTAGSAEEVAAFDKATERAEDVGLSLAQGKALLAAVQHRVVQGQSGEWAGRHRCCIECGVPRRSNGSYPVLFRTLYGDVQLASPRLHRCACLGGDGPATLSPLRDLIPGHVAPERLYLEARWAELAKVPRACAWNANGGVAGALCRRGRPARRRAAGRLGRKRHHPAPARPARG